MAPWVFPSPPLTVQNGCSTLADVYISSLSLFADSGTNYSIYLTSSNRASYLSLSSFLKSLNISYSNRDEFLSRRSSVRKNFKKVSSSPSHFLLSRVSVRYLLWEFTFRLWLRSLILFSSLIYRRSHCSKKSSRCSIQSSLIDPLKEFLLLRLYMERIDFLVASTVVWEAVLDEVIDLVGFHNLLYCEFFFSGAFVSLLLSHFPWLLFSSFWYSPLGLTFSDFTFSLCSLSSICTWQSRRTNLRLISSSLLSCMNPLTCYLRSILRVKE